MDYRLNQAIRFGMVLWGTLVLVVVLDSLVQRHVRTPHVAVEVAQPDRPLPTDKPPEFEPEWPWKKTPDVVDEYNSPPYDPLFVRNLDVIYPARERDIAHYRRNQEFRRQLEAAFVLDGVAVVQEGVDGQVTEAMFKGYSHPFREGDVLPGSSWVLHRVFYDSSWGETGVWVMAPDGALAPLYLAEASRYGSVCVGNRDPEPESIEESLARIHIQGLTKTRQMVAEFDQWGNEIGRRPEPITEVWIKGRRRPYKKGDQFTATQLTIEKIDLPEGVIVSDPNGNHHTIPFVR